MRNFESSPSVYLTDVPSEQIVKKVAISAGLSRLSRGLSRTGKALPFGVSFVFDTMQLREKRDCNSASSVALAKKAATDKGQQEESSCISGYFAVGFPILDGISRMNSRVEKAKLDLICSHCSKRIKWAWLIQYHSYQYTQLVYVCSECEEVIRIESAPKALKDTPLFSDPSLQRKK
jgi:DNA-directed RNA polymerase subunit RPC12/RpoP